MRTPGPKSISAHHERASLLRTAARPRDIGRSRRFTEDEADTAVAIQRLLDGEESIPALKVLRQIEDDLGRRGKTLGSERNRELRDAAKREVGKLLRSLYESPIELADTVLEGHDNIYATRFHDGRYRLVFRVSTRTRRVVALRARPRALAYKRLERSLVRMSALREAGKK